MRRIAIGAVALIALAVGFYVAWPAWSARQIAKAIEANDVVALQQRIDFPLVRERAKPVLGAEVERRLEDMKTKAGPLGGAIAGQLRASLGGKFVESAVDTLFTPENVIQLVRRGGDLRRAFSLGKKGDADRAGANGVPVPGAVPPVADTSSAPRRKLGLANIKSYGLTGPLSLRVGIARDPKSVTPEVTIDMAFTGTGWTVVGLLPQL